MKYVSIILTMLLMLTMLTACSGENGGPAVDDGAAIPVQTGSEEELQAVLDRIASIPVGTMGVTMKITEVAVMATDWCEKTAMDNTQLHDSLTAYYTAYGDPMMYVEQMYVVADRMAAFEDPTRREMYMSDAGYDASDYTWSDAAFGKAKVFVETVREWVDTPADTANEPCFKATVKGVFEGSLIVEPLEGEDERSSSDLISVHLPDDAPSVKVGDTVLIEYDGMMAESYPCQATADKVTVITE